MATPSAANAGAPSLASVAGMVEIDTEQAILPIARDLLFIVHRQAVMNKDAKRQKDVEKLYETWYPGATFSDSGRKIVSVGLFGPPGQGKTTAFKIAAQRVAAGLGMRYLENGAVDAEENIGPNDFVFITQETSGVVSALEWMGLPTSEQAPNSKEFRMGRLYSGSLIKLSQAGGGMLLLDDFSNASPAIQNVGLSLTLEKRFNRLNLGHVYVGVTGNLGSLDGTHTARTSTALRNRLKSFYVADNVTNFLARREKLDRDELGDAGAGGYLFTHQTALSEKPNTKHSGGFATSRSWDMFIDEARQALADVGGRQNMQKAVGDLTRLAKSLLGTTIGADVGTYYHALATSADPLAAEVIMGGKLDQAKMKERYNNGHSAGQQHFAFQFALALTDYAVSRIRTEAEKGKNPNAFAETMERFAIGILPISDRRVFTLALTQLQGKLANQMEEYADTNGNTRTMKQQYKQELARILAKNPLFNDDHKKDVVQTLSGLDKFQQGTKRPKAN